MAKVDLVAVHREDLFLRVPLLDPHREERFFDFPLPASVADRKANLLGQDVARQLLGDGAAAGRSAARRDVADERQYHPRDTDAGMVEEASILGGNNRVAQVRRDVVVVDDDAALDGELADQLAVLAEHARNRIRGVVVEGADFRQIVRVREQHAAQRAQQGRGDEQRGESGMPRVPGGEGHCGGRTTTPLLVPRTADGVDSVGCGSGRDPDPLGGTNPDPPLRTGVEMPRAGSEYE